jgi:hypothetical protein
MTRYHPDAPPPGPRFQIGALYSLEPGVRRRPIAARNALALGPPIMIGWTAGVLILSAIGLAVAQLIGFVERRLLHWR